MGDPCRTTRHCADHGWCHRCDPALAALMSEINHVIQTTVADSGAWGHLYAEIAGILHTGDPARTAAELAETRKTVQALNRRAQAAESLAERYGKAVRDWRVDEDGTYVPYESLKKIGKLAGVDILPHVRYMQRFENAQQAEEFLERVYGLLEHWNTLSAPFGPPQSWWWEERRAELSDVLAGRGSPGIQDSLRAQVRAALDAAGLSQAEAARRIGVSTKHMSQMLTGRAVLTLMWAEKILALCGQRLEIRAVSGIPKEEEKA
jgi:DNA-binding XRE family transcriptional regulator